MLQVNQTKLDPKLSANLSNSTVRDFFTVMAICNTVVISSSSSRDLNLREKKQEKERIQELNKLKYEAESPDEAALVEVKKIVGDEEKKFFDDFFVAIANYKKRNF